MTSLIEYNRVRKIYNSGNDEVIALEEVSFGVEPEEFVTVVGRSGCGKSTLLKILSQITEPTTGHADVYGVYSRVASFKDWIAETMDNKNSVSK